MRPIVVEDVAATSEQKRDALGRPRNILICSTYYWPEESGNAPYVTGLAEYLSGRGHNIIVCTGYPHYPEWRASANARRKSETRAGVEVRRRRHYVPPKQSAAHRARYESSLFITGLGAIRLAIRPDVVLGISPSIAAASLALIAAKRHRVPCGLVFQDLMGRAAYESGVKGGGTVSSVVQRFELGLARRATAVAVVSDGFRAYFEATGIEQERIFTVSNWDLAVPPTGSREETRARFGWSDADFVSLYAGSMGHKQGLDNLLHAAALLPPGFRVVLAGDGSDRQRLEQLAKELQLANVEFYGVQPTGEYEALLRAADVLLVSQRPSVTDMAVASKLGNYFAAARPVVAALATASETAREVRASGGGLLVSPAAPDALAAAILELRANPAAAQDLAERGRLYGREHLSAHSSLAQYEHFVEWLAESEIESIPAT